MIIFFRNRLEVEKFHKKINELVVHDPNNVLAVYEITFSDPEISNANYCTVPKIFTEYKQSYYNGKPFYFMNIDDSFITTKNENTESMEYSLIISILLNMFVDSNDHTIISDNINDDITFDLKDLITNLYDMLNHVWTGANSWGTCFDFINSCLFTSKYNCVVAHKTSSTLFTDCVFSHFPHHFLIATNEFESDFSLNGGLWSITLLDTKANTSTNHTMPTSTAVMSGVSDASQDSDHDWEVVNITQVTQGVHNLNIEMITAQQPETNTYHKDCDTDEENINNNSEFNKFSYRDAILKKRALVDATPASVTHSHSSARRHYTQQQHSHQWKPVVVVVQTPHVRGDRQYGAQPYDYMLNGDDDDIGLWDLVDSQSMMKQGTAVNRIKKVTMLPPKIQEQKDKRIAEKIK